MMFTKIRKRIGIYLLNRKMRKHQRTIRSMNLKDAKSIALIFNSKDNLSLKLVKDFTHEYRSKGINVEALGFTHKRKQDEIHISNDYFNFVNKNDFTYFYQPKSAVVKDFINKHFDVFIVIYPKDHIQIRSITNLSPATLKVGNEALNHHTFDLSIETDPHDVELMFENALLYLKKITTTQYES